MTLYSIAKFASRTGRLGRPLESPFPVFDMENVRFRYGATSMIAGKPGAFKSTLALNLLVRWVGSGHSAVYFSVDSDEFTVARRLAGIMTGAEAQKVDTDFLAGRHADYMPSLKQFGNVRFEYRSMEMDDIADRLAAYEAVHGSYPGIVFIDNLIDFSESSDDWSRMIDMLREFDALARETRSHICVLHHASEGYGNACDPVPRAAIQGKVSQIPRLILTVAASGSALAVCCVKNTNGPQYPDANHWMPFSVQPSLKITDDSGDYA